MEIIENDKPGRNRTVEIIRPRNLFIGIILILAGILWLLNNFGLLSNSAFELIFSWHMLVVLIGTYLLSLSRWIPGSIVTAIGMLFLGVFAVKYGDALMPRLLTDTLSHGAVLAMSLLATLACTAIVACQAALVRIAGAVTVSQPFVSQLMLLRRTYFALAVIVTSPALLLFALCPRGTGNVWFSVITIELAMTAFLYLKESLNLFISKKISILHWFLYLCSVEIFPVSLLWLSLVR